ncbi:unnamed protein product [Absidia cylindrospora]
MSYEWNNSNNNDLPPVTRITTTTTTASASTSTFSSSVPVHHTIAAPIPPPPPPPLSSLSSMRYHQHSGGEISSHQIMSHQADRIIPHGHSGKKKKGIQLSRCSSAEVNGIQQPSSSEQDSGTTSIVHQQSIQDQPHIQDLETQLDFLKGECSTIDIILASLRNAFLRDGTDTFRNTSSFLPLAATSFSSFSSFSLSSLSSVPSSIPALASPTPTSASSSSSVAITLSSLQQQSQRKADMEKEMRAGYDDLMLQVRQLEKKVESLENQIQQQRNFRH